MSHKRPFSEIEELPESLAQMTIAPKRMILEMDILPPISILDQKLDLPPMTLNPEHSQLVLYKSINPIIRDESKEEQKVQEPSKVQENDLRSS